MIKRKGIMRAEDILAAKISWQYLVRDGNIELGTDFYLLEDSDGALIIGETVEEALSNYATYIGNACECC